MVQPLLLGYGLSYDRNIQALGGPLNTDNTISISQQFRHLHRTYGGMHSNMFSLETDHTANLEHLPYSHRHHIHRVICSLGGYAPNTIYSLVRIRYKTEIVIKKYAG
jgi:hypothetical protein